MGAQAQRRMMEMDSNIDIARETIHEVLSKYFRSEKRLNMATDDMIKALGHMLAARNPIAKEPKGVTFMTEAAASNPNIKPPTI